METLCALLALCKGNPSVIDGFPSQSARHTRNVSISWRHRVAVHSPCYERQALIFPSISAWRNWWTKNQEVDELSGCSSFVMGIVHNFALLWFKRTSSNGNIFRVTGLSPGNSPVTGEFPSQRPVTRSFDVFFDLTLNKQLSKQSWGWWFETPSRFHYDFLVMWYWLLYPYPLGLLHCHWDNNTILPTHAIVSVLQSNMHNVGTGATWIK